jgi:hypothetical protein
MNVAHCPIQQLPTLFLTALPVRLRRWTLVTEGLSSLSIRQQPAPTDRVIRICAVFPAERFIARPTIRRGSMTKRSRSRR